MSAILKGRGVIRGPRSADHPLQTAMARRLLALSVLLAQGALCRAETVDFAWATQAFAGRPDAHVAVLVTGTLDGTPCTLQLDTGAPQAVTWHAPAGDGSGAHAVRVRFAGREVSVDAPRSAQETIAACRPGGPVASLGNAFFAGGTLTLDMRRNQLGFAEGSALGDDPQSMAFDYQQQGAGGHVVVDVTINGTLQKVLLDTGSAALDIGAFGQRRWEQLTGDAPLRSSGTVAAFGVWAWGREHACFRTDGAGSLRIGSRLVRPASVTYCPTIGGDAPAHLAGVLGLHPFDGGVMVIDYPARRWRVMPAAAR